VPNRVEEPADLAVLAFAQLDDEMRLALRLLSHVYRARVQSVDSPFHRPRFVVGHRSARCHDVAAWNGIGGIRQPGSERSIRRQKQEAGARHIQPADSDEPICIGAKRGKDGRPSFGVTVRRDQATRFVEGNCPPLRRSAGAPGDIDCLRVRLDQTGRIGDDAPGNGDEAVTNEPLCVGA
jgi:hypothetical protein